MSQNTSSIFHTFNTIDEVRNYCRRPESDWGEYGKYDFEQCLFTFEIRFDDYFTEFEEVVWFKNATFEKTASFRMIKFRKEADFGGCVFLGDANFELACFEAWATFPTFQNDINFSKVHFESDTFWGDFHSIADFSCCSFHKGTDFEETTFNGDARFEYARFFKDAHFQKSEFNSKLDMWGATFDENANFRWANFNNRVNMSEISVEKKVLDLHGAKFGENAYFQGSRIRNLKLRKSVIGKGVFFLDTIVEIADRETFRIIKNEFLKQNNRIEGLRYHALEMSTYRTELWRKLRKDEFPWIDFSKLADLVVLFIGELSNGFGLKWPRALIFYLITTLLIFYWLWAYLPSSSKTNYWEEAVKFLSPVHKTLKFYGLGALIIDSLGRIVASFGIYQSLQAFRKFAKDV